MQTRSIASLACVGVLFAACGSDPPAPSAPTSGGARNATEPAVVTPRAESIRAERPVGTGNRACDLFVYEWDASAPGCRLSVTHCDRHGACLACADERRIECDKTASICGERVRCACPVGAPAIVPDAPGTVALHPDGSGTAFSAAGAPDRCTARPTTFPGAPVEDAPCIVAIHECERPGTCVDRQEMLSCRVRGEICGRPVVCRCGEQTAATSSPAPGPGVQGAPPGTEPAEDGDPPCAR